MFFPSFAMATTPFSLCLICRWISSSKYFASSPYNKLHNLVCAFALCTSVLFAGCVSCVCAWFARACVACCVHCVFFVLRVLHVLRAFACVCVWCPEVWSGVAAYAQWLCVWIIPINTFAALACVSWISSLYYKVFLNIVKKAVVVVFDFAHCDDGKRDERRVSFATYTLRSFWKR